VQIFFPPLRGGYPALLRRGFGGQAELSKLTTHYTMKLGLSHGHFLGYNTQDEVPTHYAQDFR
jgi:hypothetical protein